MDRGYRAACKRTDGVDFLDLPLLLLMQMRREGVKMANIHIGDYAKIASGSVVLKPVPPGCTAAGVPARLVNCPTCDEPARTMDHTLADVVYDYVI